jgi:hypothetical protein
MCLESERHKFRSRRGLILGERAASAQRNRAAPEITIGLESAVDPRVRELLQRWG